MGTTEGNEHFYIAILSEGHRIKLPEFTSKNNELNEFLVKDALEYQKLHLGITYLLVDKTNEGILSYITLSMGALKLPEKKAEFLFMGKRLQEYPKDFPNQFPALLVGKLATDETAEGKGCASILLKYAASIGLQERERVGCAFLVAHAKGKDEVVNWYKKRGFKTYILNTAGRETVPMYFEL